MVAFACIYAKQTAVKTSIDEANSHTYVKFGFLISDDKLR